MGAVAQGEVDGRLESAVGIDVYAMASSGGEEGVNAGRTIRHPCRKRIRQWRKLDVVGDLEPHELGHRGAVWQRQRVVEGLPSVRPLAFLGEVHRGLVDRQAEHPVGCTAM
jgi:hypothetical protein